MSKKSISVKEIRELKKELIYQLDKVTIHWQNKMNQFKGGIIACDILLQEKGKGRKA